MTVAITIDAIMFKHRLLPHMFTNTMTFYHHQYRPFSQGASVATLVQSQENVAMAALALCRGSYFSSSSYFNLEAVQIRHWQKKYFFFRSNREGIFQQIFENIMYLAIVCPIQSHAVQLFENDFLWTCFVCLCIFLFWTHLKRHLMELYCVMIRYYQAANWMYANPLFKERTVKTRV